MVRLPAFRALILGPPGSGKGTISERICNRFNLQFLSAGDLLRNNIKEKTDLGLEAEKWISQGKLVPDDTISKLIIKELESLSSRWLLDGYPRTTVQAETLAKSTKIHLALSLIVPDDEIIERIKNRWIHLKSGRVYHTTFNPPKTPGVDDVTGEPLVQRDDDKEEVVKKRLESYRIQTEPVADYYSKLGLLAEFSGRESNEIWPRIEKYMSQFIDSVRD